MIWPRLTSAEVTMELSVRDLIVTDLALFLTSWKWLTELFGSKQARLQEAFSESLSLRTTANGRVMVRIARLKHTCIINSITGLRAW